QEQKRNETWCSRVGRFAKTKFQIVPLFFLLCTYNTLARHFLAQYYIIFIVNYTFFFFMFYFLFFQDIYVILLTFFLLFHLVHLSLFLCLGFVVFPLFLL